MKKSTDSFVQIHLTGNFVGNNTSIKGKRIHKVQIKLKRELIIVFQIIGEIYWVRSLKLDHMLTTNHALGLNLHDHP